MRVRTTSEIKLPPKTGALPVLTRKAVEAPEKIAPATLRSKAPPPLPLSDPGKGQVSGEPVKRTAPIQLRPFSLDLAPTDSVLLTPAPAGPVIPPPILEPSEEEQPPIPEGWQVLEALPSTRKDDKAVASPPALPKAVRIVELPPIGAPAIPALLSRATVLAAPSATLTPRSKGTTRPPPLPIKPPPLPSPISLHVAPRLLDTPASEEKLRPMPHLSAESAKDVITTPAVPITTAKTLDAETRVLPASEKSLPVSPEIRGETPSAGPAKALLASEAVPLLGKKNLPTDPGPAITPAVPPGDSHPPPGKLAAPHRSPVAPSTRAARTRKRRRAEAITFWIICAGTIIGLYFGTIYFVHDTRTEGQVIPPPGMKINNEIWIVGDFRDQVTGVTSDLADDRTPKLQEIQERTTHVQRAQADVAAREERIRLLQGQIQAAKDEVTSVVKQARDASQQIWDGPGAQLEEEYNSRLNTLEKAIADRAKSLNLKYQPDPAFRSPEVWANAFRLALYDVPAGIDTTKEHLWLEAQIKAWRDFTKTVDDRQKALREQAAQLKLSPTGRVNDLNAKIDDLQHRIDGTIAEEEPIKAELQQAQADLTLAQTAEAGLDEKAYRQLYALPESNVIQRIPLTHNGRFTWRQKDNEFAEGEKAHHYWLFERATRPDGRQYWARIHYTIVKGTIQPVLIPPTSFVSTKAILRPDLSPEEQEN